MVDASQDMHMPCTMCLSHSVDTLRARHAPITVNESRGRVCRASTHRLAACPVSPSPSPTGGLLWAYIERMAAADLSPTTLRKANKPMDQPRIRTVCCVQLGRCGAVIITTTTT
eukprot:scpid22906/ scgid7627/ 